MELGELVLGRRSIRGYRQEPVPKALVRDLIEIAAGAPSSMNTQPWHFHVITGEPLERIREENTELMMAAAPLRREIRLHKKYEGVHRDRQVEVAYQLFDAMGIREDREMRQDWMMRGFRQFDAPVSIVVTIDRSLEESTVAYLDVGAAVHALVLAAWERGLGTVINGQGISQSPVVREHGLHPRRRAHRHLRGHGLARRGLRRQRRAVHPTARRPHRQLRRLRGLSRPRRGLPPLSGARRRTA